MVVRRRKKVRRLRGGRSHGWGIQKDHKGSGMSGGKGNAGTSSHHWIKTILEAKENRVKPTGKYGFKRPQKLARGYETINVSHLNASIDTLVAKGKATKQGKTYSVDLESLGYSKLLSQGNVDKKLKIKVKMATDSAIAKIKKAGGAVVLIAPAEE